MINKSKKQLVKGCFCLFKIPPISVVLVVLVIVVCKYAKKQLLRKSYFLFRGNIHFVNLWKYNFNSKLFSERQIELYIIYTISQKIRI